MHRSNLLVSKPLRYSNFAVTFATVSAIAFSFALITAISIGIYCFVEFTNNLSVCSQHPNEKVCLDHKGCAYCSFVNFTHRGYCFQDTDGVCHGGKITDNPFVDESLMWKLTKYIIFPLLLGSALFCFMALMHEFCRKKRVGSKFEPKNRSTI
jgi:hypothetical protein